MNLKETTNLDAYRKAGGEPDSMENQRIRGKLVDREVILCVSGLISNLQAEPAAAAKLGVDEDELIRMGSNDDYRTAVEEWVRNDADPSDLEYAGLCDRKPRVNPYAKPCKRRIRIALRKLEDLDDEEVQEIARSERLDPQVNEVYEHWVVSRYFASKLEGCGETVSRDVIPGCSCYVWGRTCTGQAISMDHVIAEIAANMRILVGQENEWKD